MRTHELSTVQQGQSFFGSQLDGFPAKFGINFFCWIDFSLVEYFTLSDQRQEQVCQWGQVPGCTQRTQLFHHGKNVMVEHIDNTFYCHLLYPGFS